MVVAFNHGCFGSELQGWDCHVCWSSHDGNRRGKNYETIFTEEREGGRMEGISPVYQKKHVKFYVFLIEFLSREIHRKQLSNSNNFAIRNLLEMPEKLGGAKLKISF
jgi:hypothetical protein